MLRTESVFYAAASLKGVTFGCQHYRVSTFATLAPSLKSVGHGQARCGDYDRHG